MKTNNTVPVSKLFTVGYGTKLNLKQMKITSDSDTEGICFVSRSSRNLGVVSRVKRYKNVEPLPAGLITVTLGGTYLLSAFVQEQPFYTAQNIAILTPKSQMAHEEKLFFCLCLGKNRFRYSAFGREANRTLKTIQIPEFTPNWIRDIDKSASINFSRSFSKTKFNLQDRKWRYFRIWPDLFDIKGSRVTYLSKLEECGDGEYPYVTEQSTNNGISGFYNFFTEEGNVLTIESAVAGYCSYQSKNFSAGYHVEKLIPRFQMNQFTAIFLCTILNLEQFRYSFGRKASHKRLKSVSIKLPSKEGDPDWQFMEDYIKGLSYSSSLQE